MGVKGFFDVRIGSGTIADLGKQVRLAALNGQRVCVEASSVIYAAMSAVPLQTADGRFTAHLKIVFQRVIQLAEAGVSQIWIFDSPVCPPLKMKTLEKRKEARKAPGHYTLKGEHVDEIKKLLTLMGISWVQAPDNIEAEQYGAWLTKGDDPFCRYVVSTDSDVLIFGGNLLRPTLQASGTGKSRKTVYYTYDLEDILTATGLTMAQLRTMAVALGTDYSDKTPKIGPATVLAKVKADAIALSEGQKAAVEFYELNILSQLVMPNTSQLDKNGVLDFLASYQFNRGLAEKQLNRAFK